MASTSSLWTEHKMPDGRVYYFNKQTKQSVWEKPDELKSPGELILSRCEWRAHKTPEGKQYYYNTQTKATSWTKPLELAEAERQANAAERGGSTSNQLDEVMRATLASYDAARLAAVSAPEPTTVAPPPAAATIASAESPSATQDASSDSEAPPAPTDADGAYFGFRNKQDATEAFIKLLRDHSVLSTSNWGDAVKTIHKTALWSQRIRDIPDKEKRQMFNRYKTQRAKEEKEELRQRAKQAKEDLKQFLVRHQKVNASLRYRRACDLFANEPLWKAVKDEEERTELFNDAIKEKEKLEQEEARAVRARNRKAFDTILQSMPKVTYLTTWSELQHMLLDNQQFVEDEELQNMDKEDALLCFEEHIRQLEREHDEERERERRQRTRTHRKHREAFMVLLDELHEQRRINSASLWKQLYSVVSKDPRYLDMFGQPGSTALDLFKFYVGDLQARYPEEKCLLKDIIKDRGIEVSSTTECEDFLQRVLKDERSRQLDLGNIQTFFHTMVEKSKVKSKEEARKQRKLEASFRKMLSEPPAHRLTEQAGGGGETGSGGDSQPAAATSETTADVGAVDATWSWERVRERFGSRPEFQAIPLESERIRLFKEWLVGRATDATNPADADSDEEPTAAEKVPSDGTQDGAKQRKRRRRRSPSESPVASGEFSESGSEQDQKDERTPEKRRKKHKKRSKKHKREPFSPVFSDEEHLPESRAESDDERRRKTKKEKASLQLVSLNPSGGAKVDSEDLEMDTDE